MKNVLVVIGAMLFFFGFPLSGMLYFWWDAHHKIEAAGLAYLHQIEKPFFQNYDWNAVKNEIAPLAVGVITAETLQKDKIQALALGATPTSDWQVTRTYTGERDDSVVSFVVAKRTFGYGEVSATVSHITTTALWHVESYTISNKKPKSI